MLQDARLTLCAHPWQLLSPAWRSCSRSSRSTRSATASATALGARHGRGASAHQGPPRPHHRPAPPTRPRQPAPDALLSVVGPVRRVRDRAGPATVVDDVSFVVTPEVLGLVGESGSGRRYVALDHAAARVATGPHHRRLGVLRGPRPPPDGLQRDARSAATEIAMVFQDPMSSLNPSFSVGTSSSRRSGCTTR